MLALEEAAVPEIVHLSKRGWQRNCKNTKGPRVLAWKPPGSGETEARLRNLGLGCVVSPGAGFGGLAWENSPIYPFSRFAAKPAQREHSPLTWQYRGTFPLVAHTVYLLYTVQFLLNTVKRS